MGNQSVCELSFMIYTVCSSCGSPAVRRVQHWTWPLPTGSSERHCQSRILSDWVLLDIPCMELVIFNIKFTYLKIVNVTWHLWVSKVIQNIVKTQYKYKFHLEKYSNCNIKFNANTNVIPITIIYSLSQRWASPVTRKEYEGWRQLKPVALFVILLLVV